MTSNELDRIAELEQRIADLEARLPKHSVPATMMIQLEELEEELEAARAKAAQDAASQ
jgi:hypothetical protein